MSNFSKDIDRKKEHKEKDKVRKEKLASFFFDVAKLIIAGIVIGGITPIYSNDYINVNYLVVIFGTVAAVFFAWIGNKILK